MTQSRHTKGLENIESLYGEMGANGLKNNAKLAPNISVLLLMVIFIVVNVCPYYKNRLSPYLRLLLKVVCQKS